MNYLDKSRVITKLKNGFNILGYTDDLLIENYEFTDVLSPGLPIKKVPLATFSQIPPSYHSACFGAVTGNTETGQKLISGYRSLGAPQIFEVSQDEIIRWSVQSKEPPIYIEKFEPDNINNYFEQHKQQWSPNTLREIKSWIKNTERAYQLDFYDTGLLPLLDREVQTKFDKLLTRIINESLRHLQQKYSSITQATPQLFRLIFRLIVAKLLADRKYEGYWLDNDPGRVLKKVNEIYLSNEMKEPVLQDYEIQNTVWQNIRGSFRFQNLSVEALAYVYENTLMTEEIRRKTATHGTPPAIAEYIVRHLPFEKLAENERKVFEPFSGHAVFLVASLRRLRELLSPEKTPLERHKYFVDMLSGLEYEPFASEIARLSLMLADYPNPNGWSLRQGDVFNSIYLDPELTRANIVLCNPPFEEFSPEEREFYPNLLSTHKPVDILKRVLKKPPQMLGFILPRIFISGTGYRDIRQSLGNTYSSIEILALPDDVFRYSRMQSVLLIASDIRDENVCLTTGEVPKGHLESFYTTGTSPYKTSKVIERNPTIFAKSIWLRALPEVWNATQGLKTLRRIARIHRGLEYNISLKEHKNDLVSEQARIGFAPGLHKVSDGLEPFFITGHKYLNINPELMYVKSYKEPWNEPKVIVNAHVRQPTGPWKITASADYSGLYCYQSFYGVWPIDDTPLEIIAAVLNSPISNAFIATSEDKRNIRGRVIYDIPFPFFSASQQTILQNLVKEYRKTREQWYSDAVSPVEAHSTCLDILRHIDAEVFKAYNLSPKTERMLLDYFSGVKRPGPVKFLRYYPKDFKAYIPWNLYISEEFEQSKVQNTLKHLRPIEDANVTRMIENLEIEWSTGSSDE